LNKLIFLFFLLFIGETAAQSSFVQQIINSVNQDSLMFFVQELSGDTLTLINGTTQTIPSRNKNQPGNALAETYLKQKLQGYGLTTTVQSFSATGKNVYAVQPGNLYPNKKIIICAHFDDMPGGTIAPGADDNARGTAAVIEAARIFYQYSLPYTIVYSLWDEEEQGLIGSNYYASQSAINNDSILGVINLDMIAWDSNNDKVAEIHTNNQSASLGIKDKMIQVNSTYNIGVTLNVINPGTNASDHSSFWQKYILQEPVPKPVAR
jgi:Zn-dependent M28 family amino/carboxypeptidase